MKARRAGICLLSAFTAAALLLTLPGCAGQAGGAAAAALPTAASTVTTQQYEAPPLATSPFHEDAASWQGETGIDASCVEKGYVAVSARADATLKFQVVYGESKYNYDLPNDGTPTAYVLQSGNGSYTFRVMQNTTGTKYAEIASQTVQVTLEDEFQPFLRPSQMVDYTETSACVKKAAELCRGAADDVEVVAAVYKYIEENIRYDIQKAETVQNGYLPDPDDTLQTGQGICFDYAALAAAMLRSQGIPTKLITGYVAPDDIYHAWNMVYLESSGWITITIQAPGNAWDRIDLTFAAGGASEYIGDGTAYTDRYTY